MAESARVNWIRGFATHVDPRHSREWMDTVSSRAVGLIMRSIKIDYKFVGPPTLRANTSHLLTRTRRSR